MKQKALTKSDKIRKYLDLGLSRPQICKKLDVSQQLVYIVARNHGALTDTQSSISKKLGINPKDQTVKRVKKVDDRAILDKLWSILNEYRKAA